MNWSRTNAAFPHGNATSLSDSVANIGTSYSRLVVVPAVRAWRSKVVQKLQTLMRLQPGWDGYRAEAVTLDTVMFALQMLESTCGDKVPVPDIVPGISGDLQIEWHTDEVDIELHVRAANNVHAWRATEATGPDGEELELTVDFKPILNWVNQLSERPADADTAAA